MLAEDFVDRSLLAGQEADREGYKHSVINERAAYSDIHWTIEDMIAEGDKVASRVTIQFSHSGKEVRSAGMVFHRLSGGKITEEWTLSVRLDEAGRLEAPSEPAQSEETSPT